MKKTALILFLALLVATVSCGKTEKKPQDCPGFADYQLFPGEGGPDTNFELFVLLKHDSENEGVINIRADLFSSDGWSAGPSYDLVRSDADPYRFLHAFTGADLCPEEVCNVYFQVIAEHKNGCIKGFDTDIIQIAYPDSESDDTIDDDASDDAADDTGDDTAG